MASASDVTVPETKPATEYYFGRYIQKMSPRFRHGETQGRIFAALLRWSDERDYGGVSLEWEHHLAPPGERMNVFVPDVAYMSYARMPSGEPDSVDISYIAPDAVFEVLSPGNTRAEIAEKRRVFLACGTSLFAVADPKQRMLTVHDRDGSRSFGETETFAHDALPDFQLPVAEIFRQRR